MNTNDRNEMDSVPVECSDRVENNEDVSESLQEDQNNLMNRLKKKKGIYIYDDMNLVLNDVESLMKWLTEHLNHSPISPTHQDIEKKEENREDFVSVQQDDAENMERKQEDIGRSQDEALITYENEQVFVSLESDLAFQHVDSTTTERNEQDEALITYEDEQVVENLESGLVFQHVDPTTTKVNQQDEALITHENEEVIENLESGLVFQHVDFTTTKRNQQDESLITDENEPVVVSLKSDLKVQHVGPNTTKANQQDEALITHENEQVVVNLERDLVITTNEQNKQLYENKEKDTSRSMHLIAMDIFLLSYCNECKQKMNKKIYMCCDCYVCNDCVNKQNTCPICKQNRSLRNRYIEKIIEVINNVQKSQITTAECMYKKRGCGIRGNPTAVSHHEMVCEHKFTKCFLCVWYGRYFNDFQNHLKIKHPDLLIKNSVPFSTSHTFQIIIAHNQIFVLKRWFYTEDNSISFLVYHITPRKQTTPYYYYISFTLETGELDGLFNEECIPGTIDDVLNQTVFTSNCKNHPLKGNTCASMYLLIREGAAFLD